MKQKARLRIGLSLLTLLFPALLLAGCGGAGNETNADLKEMSVDKYVTLGDYNNLNVTVAPAQVDQEQWDQLVYAVYISNVSADNGGITDRAVEDGDTVVIDYEGKKDGVPFQNGSDTGAELTIGSGGFIDGFEEGLKGVMPGETVDLELTFPEDYKRSDELAGQAVVFTVTVHYIVPTADQMEDSVIAALGLPEVNDIAGLRQYVYDYMMESAEENYRYSLQNAIMEQLMAQSAVEELPETFVNSYKHMFSDTISNMAAGSGVDADTITNYYSGMNSEDYINISAQIQAKQEVILQAIANREGLTVGDEELQEKLQEYAREMDVLVEEMLGTFSEEEYRNYFMSEKVMEFLMERANIAEE